MRGINKWAETRQLFELPGILKSLHGLWQKQFSETVFAFSCWFFWWAGIWADHLTCLRRMKWSTPRLLSSPGRVQSANELKDNFCCVVGFATSNVSLQEEVLLWPWSSYRMLHELQKLACLSIIRSFFIKCLNIRYVKTLENQGDITCQTYLN